MLLLLWCGDRIAAALCQAVTLWVSACSCVKDQDRVCSENWAIVNFLLYPRSLPLCGQPGEKLERSLDSTCFWPFRGSLGSGEARAGWGAVHSDRRVWSTLSYATEACPVQGTCGGHRESEGKFSLNLQQDLDCIGLAWLPCSHFTLILIEVWWGHWMVWRGKAGWLLKDIPLPLKGQERAFFSRPCFAGLAPTPRDSPPDLSSPQDSRPTPVLGFFPPPLPPSSSPVLPHNFASVGTTLFNAHTCLFIEPFFVHFLF